MSDPASPIQGSPLQAFSQDLAGLVARAAPSVVAVRSHRRRASGFVWRPGLVVTADEALAEEGEITVETADGVSLPATLAGRDPSTDIALLRVARSDLPAAPLAPGTVAAGALAVASVTGAAFIRVNVHTGSMWTDQGRSEGEAGATLRLRSALDSDVAIFADVHVKHGRSLAHETIAEEAEDAAKRGLADALIVSGAGTGKPTSTSDLEAVKARGLACPIYVGSGVTERRRAGSIGFHAPASVRSREIESSRVLGCVFA